MITRIRNKTVKHSKLRTPNQLTLPVTLDWGNVKIMGKSLLLAGTLTFSAFNLFGQSINSVAVSPQDPTSSENIDLVINGNKWSSDVYINSISVVQDFNTWTVDIEFVSGGIGLPVIVPFDTIVSLGQMNIGYYDAVVNGNYNGSVQSFASTSWAVLEPVSARQTGARETNFLCTPNPFSHETYINVSLVKPGKVKLVVFDILGQEVASVIDEQMTAGVHRVKYLGTELPAGRYYFHLSADGKAIIRQVVKK
jgi:hypothetical protein